MWKRIARYSRPAVCHLNLNVIACVPRGDTDFRPQRRVVHRVLDQVTEDLVDLHIVKRNRWEITGHIGDDLALGDHGTKPAQNIADEGTEIVPAFFGA
jgi:hypothetical protein